MHNNTKYRIIIFSTIYEDWGGSEELWAKSIPFLQSWGCEVFVLKQIINKLHPQFIKLEENNVKLVDLAVPSPKPENLNSIIIKRVKGKMRRVFKIKEPLKNEPDSLFLKKIKEISPTLVVIAQGINFDGLGYAHQLYTNNIPYVTISQKAVDFFWPDKYARPFMKIGLLNALKCFFVSQHNLNLTEEQFGCRLQNSILVNNPIKLKTSLIPYPSAENGLNLACIGRLFLLDKGQDILIKILSTDKWKSRPVFISFIGEGIDQTALLEMANLLEVVNVKFLGYIDDISKIWATHHALILPSRSEGMPLVMLEAMAAGRIAIVSDAGGNAEVVIDGKNGFIGNHNYSSFADTMDRAWEARNKWSEMGIIASRSIEQNFSNSPETNFAKEIINVIENNSPIINLRLIRH